jgi:hypothetical protein
MWQLLVGKGGRILMNDFLVIVESLSDNRIFLLVKSVLSAHCFKIFHLALFCYRFSRLCLRQIDRFIAQVPPPLTREGQRRYGRR